MALARIEVLEGWSPEDKHQLLDAVERALVRALKVPIGDPTLRVVEHSHQNVRRPTVPHLASERWVLVEVLLFSGRSPEAKNQLYREIVDGLGALGVPPNDVTIVLSESPRENWGVQGGRPASEIDLGFEVEV